MNGTITYTGAILMIGGWVVGRIIGIIIIKRLDKRDAK